MLAPPRFWRRWKSAWTRCPVWLWVALAASESRDSRLLHERARKRARVALLPAALGGMACCKETRLYAREDIRVLFFRGRCRSAIIIPSIRELRVSPRREELEPS
jgi:hypothetical protein